MEAQNGTELPKWKCHKVVHGFKISAIAYDAEQATIQGRETDGSATLHHEEGYFGPIKVPHAYIRKHTPHVGGYYVLYEDGYASFSPARAFEEGYTRI